jgi:putative hydrolase of the HAD superfamily
MTEEMDAVMFDLGGTLIDMQPTKDVVFHKVLAKRGHKVPLADVTDAVARAERKFDMDFADLDGVHEHRFWKKYDKFVLESLAFKGDVGGFVKDLSSEFEGIVPKMKSWIAYDDDWPLLDKLKARGFRLGLISNATTLAREVSDHLGLSKYFETMVISDEVGFRKPDKRIFKLAASNVNLAPNRILYVGDKLEVDVVGAKKAGMNSILIDRMNIYSDVDCIRVRSLRELGRFL